MEDTEASFKMSVAKQRKRAELLPYIFNSRLDTIAMHHALYLCQAIGCDTTNYGIMDKLSEYETLPVCYYNKLLTSQDRADFYGYQGEVEEGYVVDIIRSTKSKFKSINSTFDAREIGENLFRFFQNGVRCKDFQKYLDTKNQVELGCAAILFSTPELTEVYPDGYFLVFVFTMSKN